MSKRRQGRRRSAAERPSSDDKPLAKAAPPAASADTPAAEAAPPAASADTPAAEPAPPAASADTPAAEAAPAVARTKSRPRAADVIALPRTLSEEWMAADADDGAYEEDKRRPVWLIPAIVGAVLTVGVITLFALHGDDAAEKPQAKPVAAVPLDPPAPSAVPPPAPIAADAAVVAVVPADAPEPIDAPAVVAALPDAPAVAIAPPDAPPPPADAARVALVPVDAPPAAHVDAAVRVAAAPVQAKPIAPKPPPPPKDERSIEQLVAAGEFAKANTACADNTKFSTPRLEACAIAACQTHSTALAQRWVRAIDRSAAAAIVDKCKALGVELAAP